MQLGLMFCWWVHLIKAMSNTMRPTMFEWCEKVCNIDAHLEFMERCCTYRIISQIKTPCSAATSVDLNVSTSEPDVTNQSQPMYNYVSSVEDRIAHCGLLSIQMNQKTI